MSVQVNLRALPPYLLQNLQPNAQTPRTSGASESVLTAFSFPKSKAALWDPSPNGDVVSLHLSYYRNPKLVLLEKALRLAHRHARQSNAPLFSCFLLGSLSVDEDEEGVTLTLDRFDPGREQQGCASKAPTAALPGDFLVPCTVSAQTGASTDMVVHSADDLSVALKMLQHCCSSRGTMELSNLLTLRMHIGCSVHLDSLSFSLHWAGVTVANTLDAVPVRPVPIIPTALARNLNSPSSLAQSLQGAGRKQGFLTMDQTRKLLLILESDPKAYTLPLVGVWLSGITHIHNPQVWAWCLRYLYSSSFQERVMSEAGAFLVVLYSQTHRDPEFYQCQLCSGQQAMRFQLLTTAQCLTLYKNTEVTDGHCLTFELSPENQDQFFKEVASCVSFNSVPMIGSAGASPQNKLSISDQDSGVEDEDLSPRPSPNPHPISQMAKKIHPSVPELSLVIDGSLLDGRKVMPQDLGTSTGPRQMSGCSGAKTKNQTSQSGPPPIRKPLTPVTQPVKSSKGSVVQSRPSAGRRLAPPSMRTPVGKSPVHSSCSSSSSSSSPKAGCSPNTSAHQQRPAAPGHHGVSPVMPYPNPTATGPLKRSSSFPSQTPTHPHRNHHHSTPFPNSMGSPCSCCSHPYDHIYHTTSWPTTLPPHLSSSPGRGCCPAQHHDCYVSPPRHSFGCQTSPSHVAMELPAAVCHAPCCQAPALPAAPQFLPAEGATGVLPAHAYKILIDQDRQLKLLQAQIQKLLEAQSSATTPSQATTIQKEQESPEKRESVSIAVGTGASLFWGSEDTSLVEIAPCEESEEGRNRSLPELGCFSNAETDVNNQEYEGNLSTDANSVLAAGQDVLQSPVLGESASMYRQSLTPLDCSQQLPEEPDNDEQRFYQTLLGQVKTRLEASGSKDEREDVGESIWMTQPIDNLQSSSASPPSVAFKKRSSPKQSEQDQVLQATIAQLQRLGVSVKLDSVPHSASTSSRVESTSTLACINPDAVVPRLTLSESGGTSMWGPSGSSDLSLEANAIALKYLSDSQLSRFSTGGRLCAPSAGTAALLLGKAPVECSSVGVSVLSPGNMSFATRKYMKKYGLIEGIDSSGEEKEGNHQGLEQRVWHQDSTLGRSVHGEDSTSSAREPTVNAPTLRNITNKQPVHMPPLKPQNQLLQDFGPKYQLLSQSGKKSCYKENGVPAGHRAQPQKPAEITGTVESSVGNFLDLSRLRQLPKLF